MFLLLSKKTVQRRPTVGSRRCGSINLTLPFVVIGCQICTCSIKNISLITIIIIIIIIIKTLKELHIYVKLKKETQTSQFA